MGDFQNEKLTSRNDFSDELGGEDTTNIVKNSKTAPSGQIMN